MTNQIFALEDADKRLAALLLGSNTSPSSDKPNDLALPNPWAPRPQRNPRAFSSSPGLSIPIQSAPVPSSINPLPFFFSPPSASAANSPMNLNFLQQQYPMQQARRPGENIASVAQIPSINSEPVESRYREQLETLKDMGFTVSETTENLLTVYRTKNKTKRQF